MLSLKGRQDNWRLLFDDDFLPKEIVEKYSKVLATRKSFISKPIDFINETIQKIQLLGFSNASFQQQQTTHGSPVRNPNRIDQNYFQGGHDDVSYRAVTNPLSVIDKTLNVHFRMSQGYLNYFMIFENFWYMYYFFTFFACSNNNIKILCPIIFISKSTFIINKFTCYYKRTYKSSSIFINIK